MIECSRCFLFPFSSSCCCLVFFFFSLGDTLRAYATYRANGISCDTPIHTFTAPSRTEEEDINSQWLSSNADHSFLWDSSLPLTGQTVRSIVYTSPDQYTYIASTSPFTTEFITMAAAAPVEQGKDATTPSAACTDVSHTEEEEEEEKGLE